jgi:hypothetical protein
MAELPGSDPRDGGIRLRLISHHDCLFRHRHRIFYDQRPELRHAGSNDVNREAELRAPSRDACSDLLNDVANLTSDFLSWI